MMTIGLENGAELAAARGRDKDEQTNADAARTSAAVPGSGTADVERRTPAAAAADGLDPAQGDGAGDTALGSPTGLIGRIGRPLQRRSGSARRRAALSQLGRRPGFLLALLIVLVVLVAAIAPTLLAQQDPTATAPVDKLVPPSAAHWLGTDELGRDLYARVVHGSTLSVLAALLAVGIALIGGLTLGVLAGFAGGRVDSLLMRFVDVLLALPGLLLSLAIITAIGFGTIPVAIAVGIGIIPGFARTTRAEVLRVRHQPYVEAARLAGVGWPSILVKHVLPNAWGPVAVLAVLDFGAAIIAAASLSFLGFGAAPPAAEWGTLISNGRNYLITAPWVSLVPGLVVMVVVFSINHISKTIEELQR